MPQKLILPINRCRITAAYKNKNYLKLGLGQHFGCDYTSIDASKVVFASGRGKVLTQGWDDVLGYVICIHYPNAILKDKEVRDVVVRYYHLKMIKVRTGQTVTKDTVIATYGDTGKYVTKGAYHLHVEVDTDVKYYAYSPTLTKSSRIILKGIDTTLNPMDVFYVKTTAPDNQSIIKANYDTVSNEDLHYLTIK